MGLFEGEGGMGKARRGGEGKARKGGKGRGGGKTEGKRKREGREGKGKTVHMIMMLMAMIPID